MGNIYNKGQTLIIVVVVMVVALTIGLSVISRTVTNLKVSKQNEESQRAFQAAEAGIERAIKQQSANTSYTSPNLGNNANFSYTISQSAGIQILVNNGKTVEIVKGMDVWLSNYPDYSGKFNGNLTVHWSTLPMNNCGVFSGDNVVPALEIVILEGNISSPSFRKYFFDKCASTRSNNAAAPQSSGVPITDSEGNSIQFRDATTPISISNGIIMRVIPVYNSTPMGITASLPLPSQGRIIESTGISGDTRRKIKYFKAYPQIPAEVFPYSIVSQGYSGG